MGGGGICCNAQALATQGDDQYRQQAFLDAGVSYQQALEAMLAIKDQVERGILRQQMEQGQAALRSDQAEAAMEALELALILKPDSLEAARALDRARKLEPLLALLQQANDMRRAG